MSYTERCPHCLIPPMRPMTNGFGGVFLMCLDCGYSESVKRRASDLPRVIHTVRGCPPQPATIEEGLNLLRDEARRLGRPPKVRELGINTPTQRWFRTHFRDVRSGFTAAGLEMPGRGNRTRRNGWDTRRAERSERGHKTSKPKRRAA